MAGCAFVRSVSASVIPFPSDRPRPLVSVIHNATNRQAETGFSALLGGNKGSRNCPLILCSPHTIGRITLQAAFWVDGPFPRVLPGGENSPHRGTPVGTGRACLPHPGGADPASGRSRTIRPRAYRISTTRKPTLLRRSTGTRLLRKAARQR